MKNNKDYERFHISFTKDSILDKAILNYLNNVKEITGETSSGFIRRLILQEYNKTTYSISETFGKVKDNNPSKTLDLLLQKFEIDLKNIDYSIKLIVGNSKNKVIDLRLLDELKSKKYQYLKDIETVFLSLFKKYESKNKNLIKNIFKGDKQ